MLSPTSLTSSEQWMMLLMATATCLWFFALGSSFGSFLNVVVYRMPKGLPVGGSSSHCPGCRRLIPWYDNVPILGYYRLRGRCQCRARTISARYPIVETIVGLTALALLGVELISGGANLPLRAPGFAKGLVAVVWSLQGDLIGIYLHHFTLLYVLLGLGLIDLDGERPPRRWLIFGAVVGLAAPWLAPFLQPVPIEGAAADAALATASRWSAGLRAAVGFAAGAAIGVPLGLPWRGSLGRIGTPAHLIASCALIGGFLGWQAAASVALAAALVLWILRRAALDEPAVAVVPPTLIVWLLALIQITVWKPSTLLALWPGPATSLAVWFLAALAFGAMLFATARLPLPSPIAPPPPPLQRIHVSVDAITPLPPASLDD